MKYAIAIFLFAALAGAQTENLDKPELTITAVVPPLMYTDVHHYLPCGLAYLGAEMDSHGVCHWEAYLRVGPDLPDCRFVVSEDGKLLKLVCTWKAEKKAEETK